jgi:putative membrane protein
LQPPKRFKENSNSKQITIECSCTYIIVVSIYLAISAFYELIEWWVAELTGESAEAFLGMQGYVWDKQSDMALALLCAILSLVALSKIHDRQIVKLAVTH